MTTAINFPVVDEFEIVNQEHHTYIEISNAKIPPSAILKSAKTTRLGNSTKFENNFIDALWTVTTDDEESLDCFGQVTFPMCTPDPFRSYL